MADRIDAPSRAVAPRSAATTNTQSDSDDRFVDNLILRDALHRALNRYQPFRPPAQA